MDTQVEIAGGPQTFLHSYQVKAVGAPLKLLRKTKKLLYNGLHCSPRGGPCSPKLLGGGDLRPLFVPSGGGYGGTHPQPTLSKTTKLPFKQWPPLFSVRCFLSHPPFPLPSTYQKTGKSHIDRLCYNCRKMESLNCSPDLFLIKIE